MTVLQINAIYEKYSTGRTSKELHEYLTQLGVDSYIASPLLYGLTNNAYKIGNRMDWRIHSLLSRLTGLQGYYSKKSTKKLNEYINKVNPDIIILRNLHGNYINIKLLLNNIIQKKIPTLIVLHDCWFYTGKCVYYIEDNCQKWTRECGNCPALKKGNPSWFFDQSRKMLIDKERLFSQIDRLGIIGVSKWVSEDASKSILKNAKINTYIYNWIDLNRFKRTETSKIRKEMYLENKIVLLGIAMSWNDAKGIKIFEALANSLSDEYKIILIGDTSQISNLNPNICCLGTIDDLDDLINYYSLSDIFINPSIQETFGKTTAEALACGTPVIAFNGTATPELLGKDETCGILVDRQEVDEYINAINKLTGSKINYQNNCRQRAEMLFDKEKNIKRYLEVIDNLINNNNF